MKGKTGIILLGKPGQDLLSKAREVAADNLGVSPSHLEQSPDFFFVGLDEDEKSIGVEKANDIINRASLRATSNEYQVFIIDSMNKMTPDAQNKLLKTLEESDTLIIGTCYEDNLLPTVKSRMQIVRVTDAVEVSDDVKEIFGKVTKAIDEGNLKDILVILNLVKEKDPKSFFQCHRDNVKDLIMVVSSKIARPEVAKISAQHLERCMSATYTKDDFFMYIANVVEYGGKD